MVSRDTLEGLVSGLRSFAAAAVRGDVVLIAVANAQPHSDHGRDNFLAALGSALQAPDDLHRSLSDLSIGDLFQVLRQAFPPPRPVTAARPPGPLADAGSTSEGSAFFIEPAGSDENSESTLSGLTLVTATTAASTPSRNKNRTRSVDRSLAYISSTDVVTIREVQENGDTAAEEADEAEEGYKTGDSYGLI
jgi:hypothetical protein